MKKEEKNWYKRFVIMVRLIGESISFAFSSLKTDKFRTFLSLLGVTIGIFSIVAVFSAVDALQNNINEGMDRFGSEMTFIQQWPMVPEEGEWKWWEYRKRPIPSYEEFLFIKKNSTKSEYVSFVASFYRTIKYKRNSFTDGWIATITEDWEKIAKYEIESGRNFSQLEFNNGSNVCVIGHSVSEALFGEEDPVGKVIKIGDINTWVVGKIKKEGQSLVSIMDTDYLVIIPTNYARSFINLRRHGDMIVAMPKEGADQEEFREELRSLLRTQRRLKPNQKDNFSIGEMTMLIDMVGSMMGIVNIVGWVIGGFSLLIGGFGIANIMFVSVKERTSQIGIQKALGAKRYVILTQFLVEAAVLAIMGGILGILLVYLTTIALKGALAGSGFAVVMSLGNIVKGLSVAIVIGLISGISPAYAASKLNPVEAINS